MSPASSLYLIEIMSEVRKRGSLRKDAESGFNDFLVMIKQHRGDLTAGECDSTQ